MILTLHVDKGSLNTHWDSAEHVFLVTRELPFESGSSMTRLCQGMPAGVTKGTSMRSLLLVGCSTYSAGALFGLTANQKTCLKMIMVI